MRIPQFEKYLETEHPNLLWEYRTIDTSTINRKRSHELQVRVGGAILPDTVQKYVGALRNGDEFPALVGWEDDGTFVLCDGNQRAEAYLRVKREKCDAYSILTDDPLERTKIAYKANELNGVPPSETDTLVHARNLVVQGMKIGDVAKLLNVSHSRITEYLQDFEGAARAKDNGAQSDWSKIEAKKIRVRIHTMIKLDKVFVLVVKYVANFKIQGTELTTLFDRINSYASEEDQLKAIRGVISGAEKARNEAKDGRGSYLTNPANVMNIHLAYITKHDLMGTVRAMTEAERRDARPKVEESVRVLQKLLAEIG